jgi:parallel beta-helix repeat protein
MRCSAAILTFVFLGILSTVANACMLNGPRYQLASDTVRWILELSGGETCIRGLRFNNVVVDKLMVLYAPQSGHVTLKGTGFSYQAARDFRGRDFFSLVVSGATKKVSGSSTIEVEVSVINAGELRWSSMIPPSIRTQPFPPSLAGSATSSDSPPRHVDNLCGSSNYVAASSAPTTNLCSTGAASVVSGSGPWRWSCTGSNGDATSQCVAPAQTSPSVQKPGPSADLFANPYYTCVSNYYVSTSGSDSNNGSSGSPWLTLQHADSVPRAPGDCINVAPGAYDGVTLSKGGNAATSTGYLVYRCQTLDGCTINGNAGPNRNGGFSLSYGASTVANYIIIDGFLIVGPGSVRGPYGWGINAAAVNGSSAPPSSHHIWVLNNVIHGFSEAGVIMGTSEYFYVIHNTVYDNAGSTCDAQGSGISYFMPFALTNYTPTADDQVNPESLIGSFVSPEGFFHNVVGWNVVYNNALTQCGTVSNPHNTDGNGIIMDTFLASKGNIQNYTNPTLIAFNVAYNNGGGGIHIFGSGNITIANNSCFNNYIDPYIQSAWRGCIDDVGGYGNTFINNIAVAIPAAHATCSYYLTPFAMWNSAVLDAPVQTPYDAWSNNITDMIGTGCNGEMAMFNGDAPYSATANKESTSPRWIDVGNISFGTETTRPVGSNFALQPGSPAIGYGLTQRYLPAQSVDVGACSSTLAECP